MFVPIEDDKPTVLVPLIPAPVVVPLVPPAPLPDPLFEPPAFGAGVQCAELGARVSFCYFCKGSIAKKTVRFVYTAFKSQPKYMHVACWPDLPLSQLKQSFDSLKRQLDIDGVGANWIATADAIKSVLGAPAAPAPKPS